MQTQWTPTSNGNVLTDRTNDADESEGADESHCEGKAKITMGKVT